MVFLDSIARVVWGGLEWGCVKAGTDLATAILFKIPGIQAGQTALGCFGLVFFSHFFSFGFLLPNVAMYL